MTSRRSIEALLLVALVAAPAAADDFKQHYEAGLSLYSSEDYDAAVKEFQAAYAIRPKPRLLFNIGQAYRYLGNAREALRYYLLYQTFESNPKPGLKAELESYIAQMKRIVEEAEKAKRLEEAGGPPVPSPPVPSPPMPSPLSPPPPSAAAPAALDLGAPPPPSKPVYRRGWFWGVVGGGAAAVALTTGLAVGLTVGRGYGGDIRHPIF